MTTFDDTTPLSTEICFALGAKESPAGPEVYWQVNPKTKISFEWIDGYGREVVFVCNKYQTEFPYCNTVGDLKALYRQLAGKELEGASNE